MKRLFVKHKKILGFIIFTLALPLVTYFFPFSPKPKLKFYISEPFILGRTSEKIDSLLILYKGNDLSKDSMNMLRTIIRIKNSGRKEIKITDYGEEPFGIKVNGFCKIVKTVTNDFKKYPLNKYINPKLIDPNTIQLDKIALDCGDEATVDLYLFYKWERRPIDTCYSISGRIIGGKPFELIHEGDDESVFIEFLKFMGIFIPIEIAIVVPIMLLIFHFQKQYRKFRISKKLNPNNLKDINGYQRELIDIYKVLGKKDFLKLIKGISKGQDYIDSEKQFIDAFEKVNETRKKKLLFVFDRKLKYSSPFASNYKQLIKGKLLTEEGDKFTITNELKSEVEKILKVFSN